MKTAALTVAILLALGGLVRADSIDDAEAKRRGVPVAQVQAENALATEKKKTAELERKVADLKKQLADLQGNGTPAGTPSTPTSSAPKAPPAASLPSDGTALYDYLVKSYLEGTWTTLAADLAARSKEIAALPPEKAADIKYIQEAVAECRPTWWTDIKSGKAKQFKQDIFGLTVGITYQDRPTTGFGGSSNVGGVPTIGLFWPRDRMDSAEKMTMDDVGMAISGNYRHADGVDRAIWGMIGGASAAAQVAKQNGKPLTPTEAKQFERFTAFWQAVTSAYYTTPPARKLVCVMSLASFEQGNNGRAEWEGLRPLGALLLIETKQHPYASINTMPVAGLKPDMDEVEEMLGKVAVMGFNSAKFSLADDKALRAAFKSLAEANKTWSKETLDLPNGSHFALVSAQDASNRQERAALELGQKKP